MVQRTLSRLYDTYEDATATVSDLEAAGIPHRDISLLGQDGAVRQTGDLNEAEPTDTAAGVGAGATVGTVIGGGAGLLAGLGSLAIPGIGPLVAAGWLIATVTGAGAGAAAGGLLGALTGAGVEEEHAHVYAEGVRRGGTLVTLRVEDGSRASEAEAILNRRSPVDVTARANDYRTAGWTGFDEAAGPYTGAYTNNPNAPLRDRDRIS